MIRQFLFSMLGGGPGPRQLAFLLKVAALIIFGALLWLWLRPRTDRPSFRVREAELKKPTEKSPGPDPLAEARMHPKAKPLALPGIRTVGAPHEILGIAASASRVEIQAAYRELMKRYHPDKVGPASSQQWNEAQKIAEAINRAKDEMLKTRPR